jgi:hypothetical protein
MPAVHPMLEPHRKKIAKDPREHDGEDEDGTKSTPQSRPMLHGFGASDGEFGATFDAGLEVSS